MLPTSTLPKIKSANHWCGPGRRRASAWHRLVGRPKKINARHILDALKASLVRSGIPFSNHHTTSLYGDHDLAMIALCRLIDEGTANKIMDRLKRLRRPVYDTYNRRYGSMQYNYLTGRNMREKREYPQRITRARQLRQLLCTFSAADQIRALDEVLPENA